MLSDFPVEQLHEPIHDFHNTRVRYAALTLGEGAMVMTYETGIRFLTDYLQGDVYFKVDYAAHNLDRCRTQFCLLEEMQRHAEEMRAIAGENGLSQSSPGHAKRVYPLRRE